MEIEAIEKAISRNAHYSDLTADYARRQLAALLARVDALTRERDGWKAECEQLRHYRERVYALEPVWLDADTSTETRPITGPTTSNGAHTPRTQQIPSDSACRTAR